MKTKFITNTISIICSVGAITLSFTDKSTAHDPAQQKSVREETWADYEIVHNLKYVMDHRTNICYARFIEGAFDYRVGSYTKVDCNDVKELLVNP